MTVYKRTGAKSWAYSIDLDAADPKRPRAYKGRFATRKAAEAAERAALVAIERGTYVDPTTVTVSAYLDRWLDHVGSRVTRSTLARYREIARVHLVPAFGTTPLTKLQPLAIQAAYEAWLTEGRRDHRKGGLSARTVLHHHRILKQALRQAVRWRLIIANPADAVEPPRPVRVEMRSLDAPETATLLDHATGTRLYAPLLLSVATGLRRGELLALRWKDLDLDAATLRVERSLEIVRGQGTLAFKTPKTTKSRRVVVLPSVVVEALRAHRVTQVAERLAAGPAYDDGDLLFADQIGRPWHPDAFVSAFRKIVAKAKLGHVRLHDLRHSHATALLRAGVHPKIASERLGHATVGITLDLYSHASTAMQEDAAAKVDTALRAALGETR